MNDLGKPGAYKVNCLRDAREVRTVFVYFKELDRGGVEMRPNGCEDLDGSKACGWCREAITNLFIEDANLINTRSILSLRRPEQ